MPAESRYEAILSQLPPDWQTCPLRELGDVVSGGTPSRDNPGYWGGTVPWVTPGELTGLRSKWIGSTKETITEQGLAGSGANLLPEGSLLITTRATLGARAINTVPIATNQGFKSIRFSLPDAAEYYYYWTEKLVPELERRASGTTFLEIAGSQFGQIRVPRPPRDERVKIARILDTLDTQIRRTEALIAKLEQIKQGLLTDLLTRGIDDNGQLRPPPEQAPHLYKDSPLGRIPREWDVRFCHDLMDFKGGFAFPERFQGASSGALPFYKVSDMSLPGNERWMHSANNYVERDRARGMGWRPMPEGAVVFAKVGAALLLNRRRILTREALVDNNMMAAVPKPTVARSFLYWWLLTVDFGLFVQPGALPSVNQSQLSALRVAAPPTSEQHAIAARLDQVDAQLAREAQHRKVLFSLKSGLMDDLLTGRVRVTPLLDKAEAAIG